MTEHPTSRSTLKRMRCVPTGSCFSAILRKLSRSPNVIFFFNAMTVVEQIVPVEDISPRYEGYRRETLTLTWEERRQGHKAAVGCGTGVRYFSSGGHGLERRRLHDPRTGANDR